MNWRTELHNYERQVIAERTRQRLLRFAQELERCIQQRNRNQKIIDEIKYRCGVDTPT